MADAFGPIQPAPAADTFVFDYTAQIGGSGTITAAVWMCTVAASSPVPDPDPNSHILQAPTYSTLRTSALLGNMIDGVLYLVETEVTISDGRVLTDSASLQCASVPAVYDPSAPLNIEQMRALLPAFTDPPYSDVMIQAWINLCPISYDVWGSRYQLGQALWVAHELTKFGPNGMATMPGQAGIGAPTSRSVNGVSVGYDVRIGYMDGAGPYNLTVYGQQFWMMAKLLSAGVLPQQIGAATVPPEGGEGWAWPGPYPYPGSAGFSS